MLKGGRVALSLFLLTCIALCAGVVRLAGADSGQGWISGPLYLNKVKDVDLSDIPSTFFNGGNTDCFYGGDGKCAVNTIYGDVYNSSIWVDGKWRQVADYANNRNNFYAIPNSDAAFTTSTSPVFGSYIYFTNDASTSLTPDYIADLPGTGISGVDNLLLDHFQLNHLYDSKLADKTGARLPADLKSIGFSGDSHWMIATDPNITTLRVDLTNGSVLPFGRIFTYGYGQNPKPKNAITSDGRYAAVAAEDASAFGLYDLSTCGAVPDSISKPVNCQTKDLISNNYLPSQIPGYTGTKYMRFLNDGTLSFYASYKDGNATKYAQYYLSVNPGPINKLQYLAMGDSYISGEGALHYQDGTDTGTNHCHLSVVSYPYLLGQDLSYDSYHSVACSGAVTDDIVNQSKGYDGQNDIKTTREALDSNYQTGEIVTSFSPGYIDQLDFVASYHPGAITISVGGNDIGFSKILTRCLEGDTCYSSYEDRIELVRELNNLLYPRLISTYQKLRNSAGAGARIYIIGYPQIIKPGGDCGNNVHLSSQETAFSQGLIDYLDQVIKAAADNAGVRYVDVQKALDGYRLCEAPAGTAGMNGITLGNDRPSWLGVIGAESYHPTAYGYSLLEKSIMRATDNLTQPMPAPDQSAALPSEDSLAFLNAPPSGRQINALNYNDDLADNVLYRGGVWKLTYGFGKAAGKTGGFLLKQASKAKFVINSDSIDLGESTTDQFGNLDLEVTAPADIPTGFHTLHLYGTGIADQPVDIYKVIYIADSPETLSPTADNPCVIIPAANVDYDQDGIDDACDGDIGLPPPAPDQQPGSPNTQTKPVNPSNLSNTKPAATTTDTAMRTKPLVIASDDSATQPAVLGAATTAPAPPAPANDDSPFIDNYYLPVGAAVVILAAAVYAKSRWF